MGGCRIKVCGITRPEDAEVCVDAGVDTLGLNFWPGTKRRCDESVASEIARRFGERVEIVAVVVDVTAAEVARLKSVTGIRWFQFHGDESPEFVEQHLPEAFKALRVSDAGILELAKQYPGEHLLLDASVPGQVGGTGQAFDWRLARQIASERKLTLAGGINPSNVGEAIEVARPYRVDVASGVESSPGIKSASKVHALVEAVRLTD